MLWEDEQQNSSSILTSSSTVNNLAWATTWHVIKRQRASAIHHVSTFHASSMQGLQPADVCNTIRVALQRRRPESCCHSNISNYCGTRRLGL